MFPVLFFRMRATFSRHPQPPGHQLFIIRINVKSQRYVHKREHSPAMAQIIVASLALCHNEVSLFKPSIDIAFLLTLDLSAGSSPSSLSAAHQTDNRHLRLLRPTTKKQSYRPSLRSPSAKMSKQRQKHQKHRKRRAHPSHTTHHPPSPPAYHVRPHPSPFLIESPKTKTSKHNSHPSVRNSAAADSQASWNCAAARRVSIQEKEAKRRTSALWFLGSGNRHRALRSVVRRETWAR
jgi:hypothetical protein